MSPTDSFSVPLPLIGIESLSAFLAQHERLWVPFAIECGADPKAVALALSAAHGEAIRHLVTEPEFAPSSL